MAALMVLLVIVLLLLLIALLPIRVEINTEKEIFGQVIVWGICRISGQATGTGWFIHLHLPFFQKTINLRDTKTFLAGKKPQAGKKPRTSFPSPIRLLKAFRLQTLVWSVDTGDYLQNAHLYPLLRLLSRGPLQVSVNFSGQNIFILKAYTRLYALAMAFLKST
jgi:hypothetical protein